ncbi:MAG TPA: hypothetical protein VMI31_16325 [Fimbriimonadaceae bacterium]|nr:hypothetical protein [Fimbriimonadaceae bacterium]
MESYLYISSLQDFFRFRRTWIWIVLGLAGMALGVVWPHLSASTPADSYSRVSFIVVFHVLALASAIFTTAVVSQEVEQKTIVYLLTRPVVRWKLLLMRYLASVTVVAVLGVFGAVLASIGVYGFHFGQNSMLAKDCLALAAGAISYGALFLFASLLFNRAMIICLLFAFGWETSVPNMPGEMYKLSILSQLQAIAGHPNPDAGPGGLLGGLLSVNDITAPIAWVTLGALTVVFLGLSMMWFTQSEIVPREDAE